MNKKIILSSFASLLFLSQAANAEIKIGKGSLTFNAGVSSQYIFRGIDNNKDAATPFAGADFSHPADQAKRDVKRQIQQIKLCWI